MECTLNVHHCTLKLYKQKNPKYGLCKIKVFKVGYMRVRPFVRDVFSFGLNTIKKKMADGQRIMLPNL